MPRKSNRRELIIDIATTRFLISGYDIVTVDELCELSSSTKGSFYHFFTNKESLAVDVVNHVWFQSQQELEAIFSAKLPVREKLAREIERIAQGYIRYDGKRYFIGCPIGTLGVSLRGKSPRLSRRLNFALTHMRQFYLDTFEAGLKDGTFSGDRTAAALADEFLMKLQGLSTLGKAYTNHSRVRELADDLLALYQV